MGKTCFNRTIGTVLLTVGLLGCDSQPSVPVQSPVVEPKEIVEKVAVSPDFVRANEMREALDSGDRFKARALARELMGSSEQKVRLLVIDAMEWLGKATFPELVELMNHEDIVTADSALHAWTQVLSEVTSSQARIEAIVAAARQAKSSAHIDAILLALADCDKLESLSALDELIVSSRGETCQPCAKEMFAHLSGEEWQSTKRTRILVEQLKHKRINHD